MSEHVYGATHRPIGYATVPKGWTEVGSHPSFKYGTVTYDRPLSMDEVESYELTIIPSDTEVRELAKEIAASLDKTDALELYREERPSFVRGIAQKIERAHMFIHPEYIADMVYSLLGGEVTKEEEPRGEETIYFHPTGKLKTPKGEFTKLFHEWAFAVRRGRDPRDALYEITEGKPHNILLDFISIGAEHHEGAEHIRKAQKEGKFLRFVIMTPAGRSVYYSV